MLGKANLVYKVKLGIENVLGRLVVDHADNERHDALYNQCVAFGSEVEASVVLLACYPYAALTAVNQVLVCFVRVG